MPTASVLGWEVVGDNGASAYHSSLTIPAGTTLLLIFTCRAANTNPTQAIPVVAGSMITPDWQYTGHADTAGTGRNVESAFKNSPPIGTVSLSGAATNLLGAVAVYCTGIYSNLSGGAIAAGATTFTGPSTTARQLAVGILGIAGTGAEGLTVSAPATELYHAADYQISLASSTSTTSRVWWSWTGSPINAAAIIEIIDGFADYTGSSFTRTATVTRTAAGARGYTGITPGPLLTVTTAAAGLSGYTSSDTGCAGTVTTTATGTTGYPGDAAPTAAALLTSAAGVVTTGPSLGADTAALTVAPSAAGATGGGAALALSAIPAAGGTAGLHAGAEVLALLVAGSAAIARPPTVGDPDDVAGLTTVAVDARAVGRALAEPDPVVGATTVWVVARTTPPAALLPDLSDNPALPLGLHLSAEITLRPADDGDADGGPAGLLAAPRWAAATAVPAGALSRRAVPVVSLSLPEPIIVAGRPVLPAYRARLPVTGTARQGSTHIHAEAPETTRDNPSPPTRGSAWTYRWAVADLPDPPAGGYYWLGDPSAADGTAGYSGGRTRWSAHGGGPAWHSFYPFKPSVRAYDAFLPGGGTVHHAKGVHLNPEYIEHMWLDLGGTRAEPFTWVIAAMLVNWPTGSYRHWLLDAGRSPDAVHFPRLSASDCYADRSIADGLAYRSVLAVDRRHAVASAVGASASAAVRARTSEALRPKMFFAVFNGSHSLAGGWEPGQRRHAAGRVGGSMADAHRYYVLGRAQGHVSGDWAAHALVFEIRYWRSALDFDALDEQYRQLSSAYHFARYRAL